MKITFRSLILSLAVLLLTTLSVHAQSGDLELGFSLDGKLDAVVGNIDEFGRKVGIQPATDNLVVAGHVWTSAQAEHDLAVEQRRLIGALKTCAAPVVVVSNEVGLGGVPANALARRFGQAQGALNIALAGCSDLVVNVVAGLPQVLKGCLPK